MPAPSSILSGTPRAASEKANATAPERPHDDEPPPPAEAGAHPASASASLLPDGVTAMLSRGGGGEGGGGDGSGDGGGVRGGSGGESCGGSSTVTSTSRSVRAAPGSSTSTYCAPSAAHSTNHGPPASPATPAWHALLAGSRKPSSEAPTRTSKFCRWTSLGGAWIHSPRTSNGLPRSICRNGSVSVIAHTPSSSAAVDVALEPSMHALPSRPSGCISAAANVPSPRSLAAYGTGCSGVGSECAGLGTALAVYTSISASVRLRAAPVGRSRR